MKKLILFLAILISVTSHAQKRLPDVTIKTLEGKTVKSSDIQTKDKITVISFWATWCGPCKKELDAIKHKYEKWQEDYSLEFVAISIDNAQGLPKIKPTIAQKGWKYTFYSDVNSQLMQSLGIQNVPYTLLLDKNGSIVYEHNSYKEGDEIELEDKIEALIQK